MRDKSRWRISPSLLISYFSAFLTWLIFYPGLFSVDSLTIYQQALTGDFRSFHPPLLALALRFFLKAGGTVGLFTLIACLLGFLGIRRLSLAVAKYFSVKEDRQEWVVCLVFFVLSIPLTPMMIYFATLWVDTWLTIYLIWIIAMLLEMAMDGNRISYFKLGVLVILIIFALLIRSNSIILYPPLILALIIVLWKKPIAHTGIVLLVLCPLIFYFLFVNLQYKSLRTLNVHPERVSFALDLTSMLIYNPSICPAINLQSCRVVEKDLNPGFRVGNGAIDHTLNQGWNYSEPVLIELIESPFLSTDLWLAATHYPWTYVSVKLLNFWDYIHARDQYYYQSFIHPNNLGVVMNEQFDDVRNAIFIILHRVYTHPILKYFSFVHLPWIVLNLLGILYCFMNRHKSGPLRYLGLILLIPATYYFSYLIALTASDFRFMYPSLVIMQVITLTFLLSGISNLQDGDYKRVLFFRGLSPRKSVGRKDP